MEPITHMLTGAVLSRAGLNRKAKYMTAAMVIAAELPDIDVVWGVLWIRPEWACVVADAL